MLIHKHFLTMFKVSLLKVSFCADFLQCRIIVVDTTVKAVSILVASKKILFNALGARRCLAIFASRLLSNNGSEAFTTDCAYFRFDNSIGKFGFGCHG
jgi:hypothetical protein